jgi:uncharacterized protein
VLSALAAVIFAAAALCPGGRTALAQEFPDPVGYVNDFAGVIPEDVEAGLEEALRLTEQETSVQEVVVTVKDLDGSTIEVYAVQLFEAWKIGQRGKDNGVMLIMAVEERRVRIEVGYGLEPYITDGRAGRILDESVIPDLRDGNYALGLTKGAQAIRLALDQTGYTAGEPPPPSPDDFRVRVSAWVWAVVGLGLVTVYLAGYMARSRGVWLGAVWGGLVGGFTGWVLATWTGFGLGALAGLFTGLLLDAVLSSAYRNRVRTGRSTAWRDTWGGFGGAGWRGSGGGTSGGFRGGGGRSGGGGASRGF